MADLCIKDAEIAAVEKLLLPDDCQFAEDAKAVIRYWNSVNVTACPGSGKTTVLLAKLKLLADRMPLENGAGICVLSHTNVAVDEIKSKLTGYADKLMSYPNYIGTIQSFIDRFVTVQYLRGQCDVPLSFVDDAEYGRRLYSVVTNQPYPSPYYTLNAFIRQRYKRGSFPYANEIGYFQNISIRVDGLYHRNERLAGINSESYKQYVNAKRELLIKHGILRYQDTYAYANAAVEALSDDYTSLFSKRFRYVFIDEYQDCDNLQREALGRLFNSETSCVFHIGDSDQAIFGSMNIADEDWTPSDNYLEISSTCRYGDKIAQVLTPLKRNRVAITSSVQNYSVTPALIVFDDNSINLVLWKFIELLDKHELTSTDGIYKAIGAIRSGDTKGLSIGSYWDGFDSRPKTVEDRSYWAMIDLLLKEIKKSKLYRAENVTRKLLSRIFHFAHIKDEDSGREFTATSIRKALHEDYWDAYSDAIIRLSEMPEYNRETIDQWVKNLITVLLDDIDITVENIFSSLPEYFLETSVLEGQGTGEINVFIDPIKGRRIEFDTIHGVKGETHDATLYLETEKNRGSDIGRILFHYGIGKAGSSSLHEQSRKLAYVAMSRPRKLLCVAVQSKTYEKGKAVFADWDIVDIRGVK